MYLSFSGHKAYQECPKQYWHRYVDKTQVPPDNCVNSLYGSTIGVLFEYFYRDELWRRADCAEELERLVEPVFKQVVRDQRNSIVDWADPKANYNRQEDLLNDVRSSIPRALRTLREHRFVSEEAGAEVVLDSVFGQHKIGGRADFIVRRYHPFKGKAVLDGKGSKWGMKYVEPSQVLWYSFLHRAKFGHAPDLAGFILWRFEADQAVTWVEFRDHDLDILQGSVLAIMDRIQSSVAAINALHHPKAREELREERFPAQPSSKCDLCSYLTVCAEGKAKQSKGEARAPRRLSVLLPGSGVRDLGFDEEL